MRKSIILCLLLLSGPAWAQPPAQPTQGGRLLFTVKTDPYYTEEFSFLYKKNHQNKADFTPEKVNEYFDLFVNFKLKVTEAKARGMDTTAAFRKEFKSYKDELKRPYLAEKDELERLTQEAYQRLTEEVRATHILFLLKADATPEDTLKLFNKIMAVREKIVAGEDFGKLATQLSEDPSARTNGGDLGYFTALQMVYSFESAAYHLRPGELSMPVRTRFGYHLIKVVSRQPARGEVEVSHIILRSGTTNDAKLKNKIFEIFDQLQGGRSWDELCKEYSDDPATRNSGGRLRPFGVGAMAGLPDFERMAFSLNKPGDISDPFQTSYGWHIIRLEKKIALPPYSELQASLKKKIARDERLQVSQKKTLQEKKKTFQYEPVAEVLADVIKLADSSLLKAKWRVTPGFNGSRNLFSLDGQNYTAQAFLHFVSGNQRSSTLSPSAEMNDLLDKFVAEEINTLEEEKLSAENSEFRNLVTEYHEGILLFSIMEKEVWNRASQDTAGLRRYFETNHAKYKAGERVRARIFSTPDEEFLKEIKLKINRGDSISKQDAKRFKSISPWRNYEKSESKVLDKCPWAVGVHEVSIDGIYYLVEIERLLPQGLKTFDEARAQATSDYQDVLERNWVTTLRQKYPVKINNKNKKIVVTELTKP